MMKFQDLNLIAPIMRAIEEKGYDTPTPIQQQAIPPALAGRDLLGCAQTGTGKTAAFALPIIQLIETRPRPTGRRPIQALILTPTRELAIQIDECCRDYACHTRLRHTVIFGGVNQRPQVTALEKGVDLLIATPGRLLDLIQQGYVSLDAVRYFVLDEADRMLDMGFIHDIRRLLPLLPARKQTLFFSATMPESIASLAASLLHDPVHVTVTPPASVVETISQSVYYIEKKQKSDLLVTLLRSFTDTSVLVFSRTKHGADKIARILTKAGIPSQAIHGNKSQNARTRAMTDFKSGDCRVMIATDIAARGIDISELPLVINYDLPEVAETYVHRIGRTGRAGHEGRAVSFCSEDERPLLRDIEKLTGLKFEPAYAPGYVPPETAAETQEATPAASGRSARRGSRPRSADSRATDARDTSSGRARGADAPKQAHLQQVSPEPSAKAPRTRATAGAASAPRTPDRSEPAKGQALSPGRDRPAPGNRTQRPAVSGAPASDSAETGRPGHARRRRHRPSARG